MRELTTAMARSPEYAASMPNRMVCCYAAIDALRAARSERNFRAALEHFRQARYVDSQLAMEQLARVAAHAGPIYHGSMTPKTKPNMETVASNGRSFNNAICDAANVSAG